MSERKNHKTSIGGQAVLEGIMMRGPSSSALAVRQQNGEIAIEKTETGTAKAWYKKTPLIRGVFNFVDTMKFGYKCLMRSAELSGMADLEEPTPFEKKLIALFGDKMMAALTGLATVLGLGIAILLFVVTPVYIANFFRAFTTSTMIPTVIEGLIKIVLFVGYLMLVSKMPDIRRVLEYHGAEHKTIACYESGAELTVENSRAQSRFHPRCGTSFLLLVLIISILVFSFVTWSSPLLRIILKIVLLPVVVSLAYEVIKLAGRYDNIATRIISAPGLCLQRLTTFEPDDSQIEIAIAAIKAVLPENEGDDKW